MRTAHKAMIARGAGFLHSDTQGCCRHERASLGGHEVRGGFRRAYACGKIGKNLADGGEVSERSESVHLTDEQRLDWLRLIRSQNVGPRGIMAQTPEGRLSGQSILS
jgi:hypothetical protein